ncbi:cation diffusion facilitator family transporter [Micropruina sonneratiae]|uniref:cation diffusion facilitator family transporter n=1 Tax=Micropruina sonneratiae TaxID=2986940 RepID=UPI00222704AD|nr:cation diffusion facilitator family transporter [Micropruina sp. KQZ13P-5]MCW3157633.1 cation diffusion facilitator family transporter [Micropruina sp. KQZ13P-5]
MAHTHDHHGHSGTVHRWRLQVALALVGSFFVVELVAGLWSSSLSVLSDAGHMAADTVGLVVALSASHWATRPDPTGRRTYGRYRVEIFAAGLSVLLMIAVCGYVLVSAVQRLGTAVEVHAGVMLVIGVVGLAVNVVALLLLRGGSQENLNVKGAYLEVLADALGSVGVLLAGLLTWWTGASLWDAVVAAALAVFVGVRAVLLGREVLRVLGQAAPNGIDPAHARERLAGVRGVVEVHDLHLWTLTSGMNVATAHLVSATGADPAGVLKDASAVMRDEFGIDHATLQVEPSGSGACQGTEW